MTQVHSLVLRDMESDLLFSCASPSAEPGYHSIEDGLSLLSEADRLYGHNIIQFDLPVLRKLYPKWQTKAQVRDTLLIAQMRYAHIKDSDFVAFKRGTLPGHVIGLHTLEAWGFRLKHPKVGTDIEDWTKWTPLMQSRCESDTALTKKLALMLRGKDGLNAEIIETEHELAEYLRLQEANGWPFDVEAAQALVAKLSAKRQQLDDELRTMFEPWKISLGMFTPKRDDKKRGYQKGVPVERFKTVEFNPGSRDHIANRLVALYGWKPVDMTNSGKPEVSEETLLGLNYPPVPKLREYLLLDKRLGQISEGKEAWLKHARDNSPTGGRITGLSHIHHRVKQNGTVTHRAAHASPNLGQVPSVDNPFGVECRSLFRVPPVGDWVELGCDVSGLELRCLAHYMARFDEGAYGVLVLAEKPNDVHTANANVLGISRSDAKTFIYAFLYGAGDGKLGLILAPGKSEREQEKIGKAARAHFLKEVPALRYLLSAVGRAAQRGYLELIDGRYTYIRSEHAALNSLLQGTGAVICKRWIVEANRGLINKLGPQGWKGNWAALGWIHDETQTAVRSQHAQTAAEIWIASIRAMQAHYNFRLPLDGEYKIGPTWAACH